jgi:hypothetical protein
MKKQTYDRAYPTIDLSEIKPSKFWEQSNERFKYKEAPNIVRLPPYYEPKQETLEEDIIMELQKDPLLIDFDNQVNKKIYSLKKHQEFVDKTDSKTLDLLMSEFDGEEELLIQASKKIWEEQHLNPIEMALFGFRWQQKQDKKMYSEEDMQEYAEFCIRCYQKELPCIIAKDWFEQFKKK